jgi:hypothetical protein
MTYSELDDLKATWQSLNRNLERQHALTLHHLREKKFHRFRAGFRPLVAGQIIQIIAGALLALIGGSFWVDHLGAAHLVIYGIAVHLYGIMMIVFAARDLFLIKRFDHAAPVLVLQKQIAELRRWHQRTGLWFGITGSFIWIPLLLMMFHGLGADVWERNPAVVGWFLVSGVMSIGILYAIVAFARHPNRTKFAKSLEDSSAGRTVRKAESMLEEIARFESGLA